jgi:lipopolysaccharide export LptBFGC system permease protein LptF
MKKLLILFIALYFFNCDSTKKILKDSEVKEIKDNSNKETQNTKKAFTFTDTNDYTITYEPLDPKLPSTRILPNGEVQTTTNTKTSFTNRKETKKENVSEDKKEVEVTDLTSLSENKSVNKDIERTMSTTILYVVLGFVIVLLLLGALALFLLYRTINKRFEKVEGIFRELKIDM